MRPFSMVLTALTLGTPVASAGAQDIIVRDFGTAEVSYTSGNTPKIRRGMTSRVTIIKDLIDLVPFQLVSASGGATIASLSNGRTSGGTGFIAMSVTVPSTQTTNSTITLNVGLSDKFNLRVVHRGLVASITARPQPSTISAGTPWVATVQGTDIGDPVANLGTPSCHTSTVGTRTNTSVTFTMTRQASCGANGFTLSLAPNTSDDAPNYRTSAGVAPSLSFSYVPPPPSGIACVSDPSIGSPIVAQPANNQVIVFGPGTASPSNLPFRWDSLTLGDRPAPNREWLVTRPGGKSMPFLTTKIVIPAGVQPSIVLPFAIPSSQSITIRANNCGQTAPATIVAFSTRY